MLNLNFPSCSTFLVHSMKFSSVKRHAAEPEKKLPHLLSGPNLDDPSRRYVPCRMYLLPKLYPRRPKKEAFDLAHAVVRVLVRSTLPALEVLIFSVTYLHIAIV